MKYVEKIEEDGEVKVKIKSAVENIFDEENKEVLSLLVQRYFAIRQDVEAGKMPPTISNFLKDFENRYHTLLTEEEFMELKDYADNDYPAIVESELYEGIENGSIELMG